MKKIRMETKEQPTFREGCEKYLEYCRIRNLRAGTIRHYQQSYDQFFKYFDPEMSLTGLSETA